MISKQQMKILAFPYTNYNAIICDGAVRSGKTSIMMWAFIRWAMEMFDGRLFGICGKTVDACTKNLITPFLSMKLAHEKYALKWRRSDKILEVRAGNKANFFEVFGGRDESSFTLIQGRTFAGVLLDEVVLMPESFVNQALARCSVEGAKMWFSCNPDNPQHWFYLNWVQNAKSRNALYLHFTMYDNPSLSKETIERFESMYSGVFYKRYILGEWALAEGLVYDFNDSNTVDEIPQDGEYAISVDYGTLNPFAACLWCWDGKTATMIREYYYSGRNEHANKTDEEYYAEIEKLAGDLPISCIIVDPSAANFIEVVRRHGKYKVRKAINDVIPGIATVQRYLHDGTIKIHKSCKNCIREFGLYRWDDKSNEDKPIKESDHCLDSLRYYVFTVLKYKVGKEPYIPLYERGFIGDNVSRIAGSYW